MVDPTTQDPSSVTADADPESRLTQLWIVILWCDGEPKRSGQVLRVPPQGEWIFGRGEGSSGGARNRLTLFQVRANTATEQPPLELPFLSREQLSIRCEPNDTLLIENRGKCPLLARGGEAQKASLRAGETFELKDRMAMAVVSRSPRPVAYKEPDLVQHAPPFGEPDELGLVGESEVMWRLRDQVSFIARRNAHVLITGSSGVGKELLSRALHIKSRRNKGPFVSRNAATLPAGIVDAELFGNMKNYPNPGMPERPGLIGEANGGTLFLDELGELPLETQTHLLRVLDKGGEHQRLGERGLRTSDLRLVAATNRNPAELRVDLLARFAIRLEAPSLDDRREDIPLIARHLLQRAAVRDAEIGERYFDGWNGQTGEPRFSAKLIRRIVEHSYSAHVRELEAILWQAVASSTGQRLELMPSVIAMMGGAAESDESLVDEAAATVSKEMLQAALVKHNNVREKVWRELGLPNRYVLRRLLKKHNLLGGAACPPITPRPPKSLESAAGPPSASRPPKASTD